MTGTLGSKSKTKINFTRFWLWVHKAFVKRVQNLTCFRICSWVHPSISIKPVTHDWVLWSVKLSSVNSLDFSSSRSMAAKKSKELTVVVLKLEYSYQTRSIPLLLMLWILVSPGLNKTVTKPFWRHHFERHLLECRSQNLDLWPSSKGAGSTFWAKLHTALCFVVTIILQILKASVTHFFVQ